MCFNVVWYIPEVSCESISGYDVRLYHPQSAQQYVTRHVGANRTFYIINDEDRLANSDETYVQVATAQYLFHHQILVHINFSGPSNSQQCGGEVE